MSAIATLHHAELLLNGAIKVDVDSARLSAFLAREALEELIDDRCRALNAECISATMRSKLVVLRALDTPDKADAAAVAWSRLSNACHHHAFELAPTVAEVRHLCEMVAQLVERPEVSSLPTR